MSLDELEAAYRARLRAAREPVVLICMQIREADIRALRPRLVAQGASLSEHVRTLLTIEAREMPVPMLEVR